MGDILSAVFKSKPDDPPRLAALHAQPAPAKTAVQVAAPAKAPTTGQENSNASVADERRRILSALPSQTKTDYAGNAGAPGVAKKRLLGAGTTGKATTGE